MGELPSGTVSMLFSDIEGSTLLLDPPRADAISTRWTATAGSCAPPGPRTAAPRWAPRATASSSCSRRAADGGRRGGRRHSAGCDAARLAGRRARSACGWASTPGRRGVHDGGYWGWTCTAPPGSPAPPTAGRWCVSAVTADLARAELPDGVALRDLGLHQLKDIPSPEHLYQLAVDGPAARLPAAADARHDVQPAGHRHPRWWDADGEVAELTGLLGTTERPAGHADRSRRVGQDPAGDRGRRAPDGRVPRRRLLRPAGRGHHRRRDVDVDRRGARRPAASGAGPGLLEYLADRARCCSSSTTSSSSRTPTTWWTELVERRCRAQPSSRPRAARSACPASTSIPWRPSTLPDDSTTALPRSPPPCSSSSQRAQRDRAPLPADARTTWPTWSRSAAGWTACRWRSSCAASRIRVLSPQALLAPDRHRPSTSPRRAGDPGAAADAARHHRLVLRPAHPTSRRLFRRLERVRRRRRPRRGRRRQPSGRVGRRSDPLDIGRRARRRQPGQPPPRGRTESRDSPCWRPSAVFARDQLRDGARGGCHPGPPRQHFPPSPNASGRCGSHSTWRPATWPRPSWTTSERCSLVLDSRAPATRAPVTRRRRPAVSAPPWAGSGTRAGTRPRGSGGTSRSSRGPGSASRSWPPAITELANLLLSQGKLSARTALAAAASHGAARRRPGDAGLRARGPRDGPAAPRRRRRCSPTPRGGVDLYRDGGASGRLATDAGQPRRRRGDLGRFDRAEELTAGVAGDLPATSATVHEATIQAQNLANLLVTSGRARRRRTGWPGASIHTVARSCGTPTSRWPSPTRS